MKLNYFVIATIVLATAGTGSYFTSLGLQSWYRQINLPAFTPPGSVIGTVWTILFILTGISAAIFYNKQPKPKKQSAIVTIFLANAALNVLWSYLFFIRHEIFLAIWEAGILGLSVVLLIYLLWPISRKAAILLIPYAAWTAFAAFLTYSVWFVNK